MRKEKKGPLEGLLKNIISGLGKKHVAEEEVRRAWKIAAGKRASLHTRPVTFRKARLVVNVDGSAWLYELTLKKKELLRKIEGKLKEKKVKDIRFRIGEV